MADHSECYLASVVVYCHDDLTTLQHWPCRVWGDTSDEAAQEAADNAIKSYKEELGWTILVTVRLMP